MKKEYRRALRISGILGGLCIVFGTVLANNLNHVYLSPLMFGLGIIFTVVLGLDLITRAVPIGIPARDCVTIGLFNFVSAFIAGLLLKNFGAFPKEISPDFWGAIGTGIIIGLVSVVNKKSGPYTVVVTLMLMFSFVYLKLPHCVVTAFYLGTILGVGAFWSSLWSFVVIVVGNIIGGLIVNVVFRLSQSIAPSKKIPPLFNKKYLPTSNK